MKLVIAPAFTIALITAPVPIPAPVKITFGLDVNPLPPLVIVTLYTGDICALATVKPHVPVGVDVLDAFDIYKRGYDVK